MLTLLLLLLLLGPAEAAATHAYCVPQVVCRQLFHSRAEPHAGPPSPLPADARFATFLRSLISSTVPAILLSVWQAVVLPNYFYNCAQVRPREGAGRAGRLAGIGATGRIEPVVVGAVPGLAQL